MNRRAVLAVLAGSLGSGCLRLSSDDESGGGPDDGNSSDSGDTGNGGNSSDGSDGGDESDGDDGGEDPAYPTGLSADGVDPVLGQAHANALATESFVVEFEIGNAAHDDWVELGTAKFGSDNLYTVTRAGARGERFFERGGSRELWRRQYNGDPYYGQYLGSQEEERILGGLEGMIGAIATDCTFGTPQQETVDGNQRWTVSTTGIAADPSGSLASFGDGQDLLGAELDLTVTPDSVVTDIAGQTTILDQSEEVLISWSVVTDLDSVVVDQPSWVETAVNRAPEISISVTDGRRGLRVDHGGGQPLPAGAAVGFNYWDADRYVEGFLENPLEPGGTVYAYEQSDSVRISREPVADPQSPEVPAADGNANVDLEGFIYNRELFKDL